LEHLTTEIKATSINGWSTLNERWSGDFASGRRGEDLTTSSRLGHIDRTTILRYARSSHWGHAPLNGMQHPYPSVRFRPEPPTHNQPNLSEDKDARGQRGPFPDEVLITVHMQHTAPKWKKSGEDGLRRWTGLRPRSYVGRIVESLVNSELRSATDASASISRTSNLRRRAINVLVHARAPPLSGQSRCDTQANGTRALGSLWRAEHWTATTIRALLLDHSLSACPASVKSVR
jgi:hypothetical protein